MTCRRRTVTATALGCGAALLAGAVGTGAAAATPGPDGEGDLAGKTAQQISDDALDQLIAAKSLRLRTLTTAGPTRLDITLDQAGNCAGAISKGELGRVDLIKRGNQVWMKPDAAFWKNQFPGTEGTKAAAKYKDTFLHGTTHDGFLQSLSAACDLTAFQKSAAGTDQPPTNTPSPSVTPHLTKGRPTVHEGTRVLPVIRKFDGAVQTLYVAVKGKPYPLKLTTEIDHETGTILLSNYDRPVPTKTPAPAHTVDIGVFEDMLQGTNNADA
ncbi:hypothetical protein ACGFOU_28765 [Streptomyces sp. NPDC048595]|uniref:hypothetical protein n=1 Tax=Streptomyces sp. NPDC048595 TaxID=3365576 RepID=UPI00370FF0DF